MRPSKIVIFGLAGGLAFGWLAFEPPHPRRAGAFSYQPPPERTGAPGELTCNACHDLVGTPETGSLSIDVPAEYVPSQAHTITVTLQDPGQQRWGFELVPLRVDAGNQTLVMAGSLTNLTAHTTIAELANGRQYISHTSNQGDVGEPDGTYAGTADGPVSWSFTWTAPPSGSGPVIFYAAGNAANGTLNSTGDYIYTTTAVSTEGPTTAVEQTTWGKIKQKYR